MRRPNLRWLVALLAVACATPQPASEASSSPVESSAAATNDGTAARNATSSAATVRQFGFTVSDLDASLQFYRGLGFHPTREVVARGPAVQSLLGFAGTLRVATLALGSESLELRECSPGRGRPIPETSRSNDATFQHVAIVVRDIDRAYSRARELKGFRPVSPGPQTIPFTNPDAGGIRAAYFKDQDGHNLELIWFPEGRGNPRWQVAPGELFLGIDHSAIAVSNTAVSEGFYAALGFSVGGRALNSGVEQEALSGVPGARVEITGMAPPRGPSVEFLSYLEPGPGTAVPRDARPCDLWHWETELLVSSVKETCALLETHGGRCAVVEGSAADTVLPEALLTDPDGHTLALFD